MLGSRLFPLPQPLRPTPPPAFAVLHRLMAGCEEFLALVDRLGLTAWPDWGTLLGLERHRNVIPWDYDADFCLCADDYGSLRRAFAQVGGTIGTLRLVADYYGEPDACCTILFADWPDDECGIDLVAYTHEGDYLRHRMSPRVVAISPGTYDWRTDEVWPLGEEWFLGRRVRVPRDRLARIRGAYGDHWRQYPAGHSESAFTAPPFQVLPERGAGRTVIRAVPAPLLAQAGVTPGAAGTMAFSDLVFLQDGLLWGKVYLGLADDATGIPDGCVPLGGGAGQD